MDALCTNGQNRTPPTRAAVEVSAVFGGDGGFGPAHRIFTLLNMAGNRSCTGSAAATERGLYRLENTSNKTPPPPVLSPAWPLHNIFIPIHMLILSLPLSVLQRGVADAISASLL